MGFKEQPQRSEPARNPAEKEAKNDHDWEKNNTSKDPVPQNPPDWAKDIPSPKP